MEYGIESKSSVKRNLLNPDEIMRMSNDEQIVMIRGQKPFKCKKLRYWDYRLKNNIKETSIEDYNPDIISQIKPITEERKEEKLPTFDEVFMERRKKKK